MKKYTGIIVLLLLIAMLTGGCSAGGLTPGGLIRQRDGQAAANDFLDTLRRAGSNNGAQAVTEAPTAAPTQAPTEAPTEPPTPAPTTAAPNSGLPVDPEEAYYTIASFYDSYIDAVNEFDSGRLRDCTEEVAQQMADRFSVNSKSYFILRRLDYDVDSVMPNHNGTREISVKVKAVSEKYDRGSGRFVEMNYACWRFTVIDIGGGHLLVNSANRNDDLKLGSNVFTINM